MLVGEIKEIAQQRGVDTKKMKKADLVQAIQMQEGNEPCFNTGARESCGQYECLWRGDCR